MSAKPQRKITDIIEMHRRDGGKPMVSFEVFPGGTFHINMFQYSDEYPSFFSIVWKANKHINLLDINEDNVNTIPAIILAKEIANQGYSVVLHLTCIDMKKSVFKCILDHIKSYSIRNILLLRGDDFNGSSEDGFNHTSDMIAYVRENYDNYFCIGVAGFPSSTSVSDDMKYLKLKVDLGANFIITQMFYNIEDYTKYLTQCRNNRIGVPVIAGILSCTSYNALQRFEELSRVSIPQCLLAQSENVQSDDEAFVDILNRFIMDLIENLLKKEPMIPGIHWFTLNKSKLLFDIMKRVPHFNHDI